VADFPSPPTPPISVVVCTRDRPDLLRRCLNCLALLDYPDFEVLVIDNASRDAAQVRRITEELGMRYVREAQPGLDWARNCGLAEARHAIVAYTDDDGCADAGWLRGLARAFADPAVDGVTGLVLPLELESEAQRLFERYGGMGKGEERRRFQRQALRPHDLIAAHHVGVGANMAFRYKALLALKGFDTALDVGTPAAGGGDLDLFHRALVAGLTIQYEPTALIRHQHRREMAGLRRQLYANGRAFGVYLLKICARRSVPRRYVCEYALRWLVGWVLARVVASALGRLDFPLALCWAELWGACSAPWAYLASYRADRRAWARSHG
jgi:glycosyltransferase involved in cell wall biosynthesis